MYAGSALIGVLAAAAEAKPPANADLTGVALADRHVLQTAAQLIGEPLGPVRLGGHAGRDRRWWPVRRR